MTKTRNLGIWMDHSKAHLMECSDATITSKTIESKFTHQEKQSSLDKGENLMHNKEQHLQSDYYKELAEAIKNFDSVVLFGPTDAKMELKNILKGDHHFDKIKIQTCSADKMTESQEHVFVREYFSKN